jgi:hypothetical protein
LVEIPSSRSMETLERDNSQTLVNRFLGLQTKMTKLIRKSLTAAAILALSTIGAKAVTFVTPSVLPTNTSFSINVNAASGGQAIIAFDLLGWASLDGVNYYEDDFTLTLNGSEIFKGAFSLGGGGDNSVFTNTFGLNIAGLQPNVVTFAGGDLLISGLLSLASGNNIFTFSYLALASGHAGFQGTGDEAWGVRNLNISAVPLPPAAILLGTSLLAFSRKRRTLNDKSKSS